MGRGKGEADMRKSRGKGKGRMGEMIIVENKRKERYGKGR